jgi:hypothetical protein
LGDERQPAISQRTHLEIVITKLDGDAQGAVGTGLQIEGIGTEAGQHRQLEIAPLHTRTYLVERATGSLQPTLGGGVDAERLFVQLSQLHGGAGAL